MAQSVGAVALDIVMGKNTVSGVAKQAIADVQKTFNDGTATIGNKVSAVGQACQNVGASLAPVSLAAQGVIKSTTSAAMNFETAMAQVKTIAGNASVSYKGDMKDMSSAIMQLSTDTGIAAEDVAAATYSAISAGVDTAKSVEFVATANALAVGGFTDMNTSVDVLTTTMNAYGEKAGTAESISDKLITTQNLGKTTVNELASSMGKVIPTASAYGISLDNLCASYVAMTKGGIATAEATTYMKSMFNELADSGSTVGTILQEKTGKSFGQLMGEGKSLADVIDILGASVDGDSEKFAQLWGSAEAGTGALAILNGGTADFNSTLSEMGDSTGAASTALDTMNNTSAHKLQLSMNKMKNAAIELGGAFAPVMTKIAEVVGNVATAFSNLSPEAQSAIATVVGIVAVASPVLMIFGGLVKGIGSVISTLGLLKGAIAGLSFNPMVLAITGVITVGALLIANWDKVKEVATKVWNGVKDTVSKAVNGAKDAVTKAWNTVKTKTTEVFNNVKEKATSAWNSVKSTVSNAVNNVKSKVSSAWNSVKEKTSSTFNSVKEKTTTAWNSVKTSISNAVSNAKSKVSSTWDNIKTKTSTAWSNVKSATTSAWNNVKTTITNAVNNAKSKATQGFENMKTSITTKCSGIKNAVTNAFDQIKNKIKNLASEAVTWGKDFIEGLARGIRDNAMKVVNSAKDLAGKMRNLLHFSRPDEGPLRDYETWMPDFMSGLQRGIQNNKMRVVNAMNGLAHEMKQKAVSAVEAVKTTFDNAKNKIASTVKSVASKQATSTAKSYSATASTSATSTTATEKAKKKVDDKKVKTESSLEKINNKEDKPSKEVSKYGKQIYDAIAKISNNDKSVVADAMKDITKSIKSKASIDDIVSKYGSKLNDGQRVELSKYVEMFKKMNSVDKKGLIDNVVSRMSKVSNADEKKLLKDFATAANNAIKSAEKSNAKKVTEEKTAVKKQPWKTIDANASASSKSKTTTTKTPKISDVVSKIYSANNKIISMLGTINNSIKSVQISAPHLKNVGKQKNQSSDAVMYEKITKLLSQIQKNTKQEQNVTIPIYIGNDLIDEIVLRMNDRRVVRSGGRA